MKRSLTGIATVFAVSVVAGIATRPDPPSHGTGSEPNLIRQIHAARKRQSTSLIEGGSGIDLSGNFSGVHRVEKAQTIIESAEFLEPEDFPDLFEGNRHDPTIGRMLAKRWSEVDPEAFYAYLVENPGGDGRPLDSWEILFRTWGAMDPDAAFAAADRMSPASRRRDAFEDLTDVILRKDPDKALALIAERPGYPVFRIPFEWLREDPGGMAGKLVDLPESRFRSSALESALSIWFNQAPDDVIEFVLGLDQSAARSARLVIDKWAQQDPEAAAEFAINQIQDEAGNAAAVAAVSRWAIQNPEAAWTWAMANLWGRARKDARRRILDGAADTSPDTAVALINTLPDSQRDLALRDFARSFADADRDAALEWAHAQTDPEFRDRIFFTIGDAWANGPFREMAKYVRENAESVPESFVNPLASRWGGIYPMEALGWQMNLPDELGIPASERMMRSWARKTPAPAADHVFKMGHPEKRIAAFNAVAPEYLRRNFEPAVKWLTEAEANHDFSPEQIRNAIRKASLSTDQRDAALSRLGISGESAP